MDQTEPQSLVHVRQAITEILKVTHSGFAHFILSQALQQVESGTQQFIALSRDHAEGINRLNSYRTKVTEVREANQKLSTDLQHYQAAFDRAKKTNESLKLQNNNLISSLQEHHDELANTSTAYDELMRKYNHVLPKYNDLKVRQLTTEKTAGNLHKQVEALSAKVKDLKMQSSWEMDQRQKQRREGDALHRAQMRDALEDQRRHLQSQFDENIKRALEAQNSRLSEINQASLQDAVNAESLRCTANHSTLIENAVNQHEAVLKSRSEALLTEKLDSARSDFEIERRVALQTLQNEFESRLLALTPPSTTLSEQVQPAADLSSRDLDHAADFTSHELTVNLSPMCARPLPENVGVDTPVTDPRLPQSISQTQSGSGEAILPVHMYEDTTMPPVRIDINTPTSQQALKSLSKRQRRQNMDSKAQDLSDLFHLNWAATEDEISILDQQLRMLFRQGKSLEDVIEKVERHVAGTYRKTPVWPRPCLMAELKNQAAGPGGTMQRSECPYCLIDPDTRLCVWASHVDGVGSAFENRGTGRRYNSNPKPWTVRRNGREVRFVIHKR